MRSNRRMAQVNELLRTLLPRSGEGWLSEESIDDKKRLEKDRVWVVDPLDGTREFIAGIPEWCVSIGFVMGGHAVAGGILNPTTGERFLGEVGRGVTLDGRPVSTTAVTELSGARVLASRSEVHRGEWARFEDVRFDIRTVGSVAYKLALVAAGRAEATWTLTPKNEWDVAAGVALLHAAGGRATLPGGGERRFNQADPLLSGLLASWAGLLPAIQNLLLHES